MAGSEMPASLSGVIFDYETKLLQRVSRGEGPGTPHPDWIDMALEWCLIDDLLGGTLAMRRNAEVWLPQEASESSDDWWARVNRTTLFGMFKDSVRRLADKPTQEDVEVRGEFAEERIVDIEGNCDRAGRKLTNFAFDALSCAWSHGLVHGLVDMPAADGGISRKRSRELSLRPYFVMVHPRNLIGWDWKSGEDGLPKLTSVRIIDSFWEQDEDFQMTRMERVREWTETEVKTWKRRAGLDERSLQHADSEGGEAWPDEPNETRQHNLGEVPLRTLYAGEVERFMVTRPPLADLAWLNLQHYQSSSEQRTILRVARWGLLFMSGVDPDDKDKPFKLGPLKVVRTTRPAKDADTKIVTVPEAPIAAGERDLEAIERRGEVLGMKPFMQKKGSTTAFERGADEDSSDTMAVRAVRNCEAWIDGLYELAHRWLGREVPESFEGVQISDDFGVLAESSEEYKLIQADRDRGDISGRTLLLEAKRRRVYGEELDVDEELEAVEDESEKGRQHEEELLRQMRDDGLDDPK